MMKLLSYKFKMFVPFGDGEYRTVYELTILKSYLFGLIKRKINLDYSISMFERTGNYEKHWNDLIKTGKPL